MPSGLRTPVAGHAGRRRRHRHALRIVAAEEGMQTAARSRSPTAMSLAVVSSLYLHDHRIRGEHMTATYTSTSFQLDGYGSHNGDWGGY